MIDILGNIKSELHRLRVAMLDHAHPRYKEYWAAQQALAWAIDPKNFAPPLAALTDSEPPDVHRANISVAPAG